MTHTASGSDHVTTSHKINKAALAVLVVLAGLASLILPALVPAATPGSPLGFVAPVTARADGAGHSLKITHKSNDTNDTLIVCKDWTSSSSVTTSCSSKFASLAPGKNTVDELGWSDTDGARIPKGRALKVSVYGPDYTAYRNCTSGTKWKKLSPYVYGGTASYVLYLVDANC